MGKRRVLVLLLCGLLLPILIFCSPRVKATGLTFVRVVNPATGDGLFKFTTNDTKVGDTFFVNITVENVTNLNAWQVALSWNTSLLDYVNIDDILFYPEGFVAPPEYPLFEFVGGTLYIGNSLGPGQPPSFSGSAVMFRIEVKVLGIGQSNLTLESDTFLADNHALSIPFTPLNASYRYYVSADVNNDGAVGIKDVAEAVAAFNSFPGKPNWNPYADLNNDGTVNTRDIVIIIFNFNKHP